VTGDRADDYPRDPDDPQDSVDGEWCTEAEVTCPYCGERVTIALDPTEGSSQTYVEDCQVCCQPWQVHVRVDERGIAQVWVEQG
jgi:cysteine-rich CPXCG protein